LKNKFKIILFFGLLFTAQQLCAQNFRATYSFQYKSDSLKENFTTFPLVLEVQGAETFFFYEKFLALDSLYQKGTEVSISFPFLQTLSRKTGGDKNSNYFLSSALYFSFPTEDKIEWKITPQTDTLLGYSVQKAVSRWQDRSWIAWFTTEIPLPEGPYKFNGLPGLVVNVQDTKNNFKYELIGFQKQAEPQSMENIVWNRFGLKPKSITLDDYKKLLLNHFLRPFTEFEHMEGNWGYYIGEKEYTSYQELLQLVPQEQKQILQNFNPIERERLKDVYNKASAVK